MWEIIRKSSTRMKLKTIQTLWKLDYLRFFWNYLVINYVFERKYITVCFMRFWDYAMCDFPVITRFGSIVFMTTIPNLGQCPFTLDDAFFPTAHGGKRFLDCVWVRLLSMGPKDHMQKRSYLTCSPCCPWEKKKKNL